MYYITTFDISSRKTLEIANVRLQILVIPLNYIFRAGLKKSKSHKFMHISLETFITLMYFDGVFSIFITLSKRIRRTL